MNREARTEGNDLTQTVCIKAGDHFLPYASQLLYSQSQLLLQVLYVCIGRSVGSFKSKMKAKYTNSMQVWLLWLSRVERASPPHSTLKATAVPADFLSQFYFPTPRIFSPHLFLNFICIKLRKSKYDFHFTVSYV